MVSEHSILLDPESSSSLPPNLLFYKDLTNLRSSFNVSILKAKKNMHKKITTWSSSPQLEEEISQSLEECYRHVKVFERTLKELDVRGDHSIMGQLVNSIKNCFSLQFREMVLELKDQEQQYFQKLQGVNGSGKKSEFDFMV